MLSTSKIRCPMRRGPQTSLIIEIIVAYVSGIAWCGASGLIWPRPTTPSAKMVTRTGLPRSAPGAPVSYGPVERWRSRRVFKSVTRISMRSMRMSVVSEVELFESLLRGSALTVFRNRRVRIGTVLPRSLEIVPGGNAARLKIGHEIPKRSPKNMVCKAREPRDVDAELKMLLKRQMSRQFAFHEGKRPGHCFSRGLDFIYRVRRFELHPIDAGLLLVGPETSKRVFKTSVLRIAGVALRHDDKVRIELVAHVDSGTIASDRLFERHHRQPCTLRPALAFNRLIVDPHAGDSGANAFPHHAPHRHDAAVAGIAIHDDGKLDGLCNPSGNLDAFEHGERADIGETGVGTDHAAGPDEADLAAGPLHDPREARARGMQYAEHAIDAIDQSTQLRRRGFGRARRFRHSTPHSATSALAGRH